MLDPGPDFTAITSETWSSPFPLSFLLVGTGGVTEEVLFLSLGSPLGEIFGSSPLETPSKEARRSVGSSEEFNADPEEEFKSVEEVNVISGFVSVRGLVTLPDRALFSSAGLGFAFRWILSLNAFVHWLSSSTESTKKANCWSCCNFVWLSAAYLPYHILALSSCCDNWKRMFFSFFLACLVIASVSTSASAILMSSREIRATGMSSFYTTWQINGRLTFFLKINNWSSARSNLFF